MGSERDLHKQGNAAQDNSQRNIKVPADAIPQAAAGLPAAGIDGRKQLVFFHYIEPGNSAQRSADGDDIDGNKIHPRPPLGDGLHTDAEAKAQYGQDDEGSGAAQPGNRFWSDSATASNMFCSELTPAKIMAIYRITANS